MTKCVFGQHFLIESECLKVRNSTTSAILWCSVHQLASLGRHAQLKRCFSAVAELLVLISVLQKLTSGNCGKSWSLYSWLTACIKALNDKFYMCAGCLRRK